MSSLFDRLHHKGLVVDAPSFVKNSVQYEVLMGSVAYGVSNDTSDMDVYGFCVPSKEYLFPQERGLIWQFDDFEPNFGQYVKHHIQADQREYDMTIYNITKFFRLVMDNNPNMVDSLFVPQNCVLHQTSIGVLVRENRHLFLHKGCWHKFKGYAYSQLQKIKSKNPAQDSKRYADIEKHGFDVKFAYHVVRLILEVEQILAEQDLDLQRHKEQLRAIRNGEWSLEKIISFFEEKEKQLEKLYHESKLPYSPDVTEIRKLLAKCLNMYFSEQVVIQQKEVSDYRKFAEDIKKLQRRYGFE